MHPWILLAHASANVWLNCRDAERQEKSIRSLCHSNIHRIRKRNLPLCRSALSVDGLEQAVVLTESEIVALQGFAFVRADGECDEVKASQLTAGTLILLPEDFGDEEN
jgi:hypothetical protein